MKIKKDQHMTTKELAYYLNCSVRTIKMLKKEGKIPYYQVNHIVRFNPNEVDTVIRKEVSK